MPPVETVLVHLGWPVPEYLRACAAQVRHSTGRDPLIVGPRQGAAYRTTKLTQFRRNERLSGFGLDGFWRHAAERFFVLEAFMEEVGLERCLHIESDNLLYRPTATYASWLDATYGAGVATCPLTETEDTAAVLYAGSRAGLSRFNEGLLELVAMTPERLLAERGGSMANEMRMLHVLRAAEGLAAALPTTIDEARAAGCSCVFDPASYGQQVDGIPGAPGTPYAGDHHTIGRELIAGRCEVTWDSASGTPSIRLRQGSADALPLANLHVHSKRLERWVTPGTESVPLKLPGPRLRDRAAMGGRRLRGAVAR